MWRREIARARATPNAIAQQIRSMIFKLTATNQYSLTPFEKAAFERHGAKFLPDPRGPQYGLRVEPGTVVIRDLQELETLAREFNEELIVDLRGDTTPSIRVYNDYE